MATNEPIVSVVTPVYNTADYLREAIESVLAQSYDNFEYIIADNRSTDGSRAIAHEYERLDSRVRVFDNTEFLRQLPNFNNALKQISPTSKYCKIVLADDWIFPNCLSEMVRVAEKDASIGIVSAYTLIESSVYLEGLPYSSEIVSGRDACRRLLLEGLYLFGTPNSLLYRSELVRGKDPFYTENAGYFEDADLCCELLKTCNFGFVHQVLTFTRREHESIFKSVARFDPFPLMELMLLEKYGRYYLSADEFKQRLMDKKHEYLLFIGESLLRAREKSFWDYHERGLQRFGYSLPRLSLAKYAALALLDLALNPKSTIERLIRLRRRQGGNPT